MDTTIDELEFKFNNSILFQNFNFSLKVKSCGSSVDISILELSEIHRGAFGTDSKVGINGAVVSAGFEAAIGVMGLIGFQAQASGVIELSVKYLKILRTNGAIFRATITEKSRNLIFCSASLYDLKGVEVASASGIVAKL